MRRVPFPINFRWFKSQTSLSKKSIENFIGVERSILALLYAILPTKKCFYLKSIMVISIVTGKSINFVKRPASDRGTTLPQIMRHPNS